MNAGAIRAKMKNGAAIGSWLQLPSPEVAEIMGRAGYDWVAVDMEHGLFTRAGLADVCRAIELGGAAPFARVAEATKNEIKGALEAGAQGLIFPMIESRAQLDEAISWALYPDQDGSRGVGFCRANLYGKNLAAYRENAAKELILAAQIEHIRAVEELPRILAHPRLDAIMVGPYDLSGSMGLTGRFDHPDFIAAMQDIQDACARHGANMGIHIVEPNPAELAQRVRQGFRFIAYGIDAVFLWRNAQRPGLP
ncbi:MAG: aldolase/citrate lyase family protein [Desulfovibrionaceae bacterium]|nr:aldolase/citrate lyase family protein [Desulfovibrionaceae bacterium]